MAVDAISATCEIGFQKLLQTCPNGFQWFAGRSGRLTCRVSGILGPEKLYNLEGRGWLDTRMIILYVAYKCAAADQPVVTSEAVAQPSGGEEIVSKGLTFHYDSIQGLKVITWSDRGLTCALLSDLEERGWRPCIVCHQGTRIRTSLRV
jgi:hypothetical protein